MLITAGWITEDVYLEVTYLSKAISTADLEEGSLQ